MNEPQSQPQSRICGYNGCPVELDADQLFRHCESCRILKAANAARFLIDPCSPILDVKEYQGQTQTLLTELTGEEILRYMEKLEEQYLNVCKLVKLHGLTASHKKPVQTAAEFVETIRKNIGDDFLLAKEARGAAKKQKESAKAETKIQKLAKMLNMSESQAKLWMSDATEDEGF